MTPLQVLVHPQKHPGASIYPLDSRRFGPRNFPTSLRQQLEELLRVLTIAFEAATGDFDHRRHGAWAENCSDILFRSMQY